MMLGGKITQYHEIVQGFAQGCTLPPILFELTIYDLILGIEAAKQAVSMAEDMLSGLMFADDSVGISARKHDIRIAFRG